MVTYKNVKLTGVVVTDRFVQIAKIEPLNPEGIRKNDTVLNGPVFDHEKKTILIEGNGQDVRLGETQMAQCNGYAITVRGEKNKVTLSGRINISKLEIEGNGMDITVGISSVDDVVISANNSLIQIDNKVNNLKIVGSNNMIDDSFDNRVTDTGEGNLINGNFEQQDVWLKNRTNKLSKPSNQDPNMNDRNHNSIQSSVGHIVATQVIIVGNKIDIDGQKGKTDGIQHNNITADVVEIIGSD